MYADFEKLRSEFDKIIENSSDSILTDPIIIKRGLELEHLALRLS